MRFVDYRPAHSDASAVEHVRDQLEPGTPDLWLELAEAAFAVLSAHPMLKEVAKRDLARCAISVVFQLMAELGGQTCHLPSAERALYLSMKEASGHEIR
ncbi:MAG: hypothetical protein E6Q67_14260 [Roseateles sp.]|nr:MAG: hypothetical protein E6Q67_14260 [Roseateles sp.]